ncbi:MAG: hypothetical protein WKF84_06945 [Pyrinomonadaceae bacterium]
MLTYLRLTTLVSLVGGAYLLLFRPLRKRVSDRTLARFIEEKQPDARDRFVASVEVSEGALATPHSWAVTQRLVHEADQYAAQTSVDKIIPQQRLLAYCGIAATCLLLFIGTLAFGPQSLWRGVKQLVAPASAVPYSAGDALAISVHPGNARVPRGSDQKIVAKLSNTGSESVTPLRALSMRLLQKVMRKKRDGKVK